MEVAEGGGGGVTFSKGLAVPVSIHSHNMVGRGRVVLFFAESRSAYAYNYC